MRRIFGKVIFFGLLVLSSMGVVHAQVLYSTLPADPDGVGPASAAAIWLPSRW